MIEGRAASADLHRAASTGPLVGDDLFRRLCRSRDVLAASLDRPLRLADAAQQAFLSPFHYHRLFTRTFGETPHEFVTRLRIDRAKWLLVRRDLPITEVCLAVGYESLGSFSARFRSLVGYSPSAYQREIRRVFAVPLPPAASPGPFLLPGPLRFPALLIESKIREAFQGSPM